MGGGGASMLSHGSSPKPEGQPRTGGTGTVCVTWCRSKDREPGGVSRLQKRGKPGGSRPCGFCRMSSTGVWAR